jgi:hypothetical protein
VFWLVQKGAVTATPWFILLMNKTWMCSSPSSLSRKIWMIWDARPSSSTLYSE